MDLDQVASDKDSAFLYSVSVVADMYGCYISKIDIEKRILEIEGPEDMQVKCATVLEKLFKKYLAE